MSISRRSQEDIELHDKLDAMKSAIERLQAKVKHLHREVAALHAERDRARPLPAWCGERLYLKNGDKNPLVPWLHEVLSVRLENCLENAASLAPERGLVTTTRDMLALSHETVLTYWKNFGRKSLNDVLRALEIYGVRWPSSGRSE